MRIYLFISLTRVVVFLLFGLFLLVSLFFTFTPRAFAATGINRTINFQGKLVNSNGTNVTDGSYSVVFSFYDLSSGGTALWSETQNVTATDGIFRVALGSSTAIPANFNFNWDGLYLGMKVGADSEMTPRIRMASVPFAFNAEKVSGLTVQDENGASSTSGTLKIPNAKTVSFSDAFTTSGAGAVTLTNATDGFTLLAGLTAGTQRTLTVTGADITIGSTIKPTAAGALIVQSNSTNTLTLDTGGGAALNIGTTNATSLVLGNATSNPTFAFNGSGTFGTSTGTNTFNGSVVVAAGKTLRITGGAGDPTATSGIVWYDTTANKFKIVENGAVKILCNTTDNGCGTGGGGGSSNWTLDTTNGVLRPNNNVVDFLLGGTATTSAKFAVLNLNTGLTPIATVAGNFSLGADAGTTRTIGASAMNALQFGDTATGDLIFAPANTAAMTLKNGGNIGIGTTVPTAQLQVRSAADAKSILTLYDDAVTPVKLFEFTNPTGTMVNGLSFIPSAAGASPNITAQGSDTNIGLSLNSKGAGTISLTSAVVSGTTTTSAFNFAANSLTSGTGLYLASTNTTFSSGILEHISFNPGSTPTTAPTGDLLRLSLGTNATNFLGNYLNIVNSGGSSILGISETAFSTSLPANFTAAGDVSASYDLVFTNPTASYIKSAAPLYITAGETFNSSDLVLQTYNSGQIVFDSPINGKTVVSDTTSTGTGTVTVSTRGVGYYLNDSSGTTNTSYTTTINVTGVPDVEGTIVFMRTSCQKGATTNARQHTCQIQMNGTNINSVATLSQTGASTVIESYIAIRINSSWRIVTGTVTADTADLAEWMQFSGDQPEPGDIVTISQENIRLKKADTAYDSKVLGIISTNPFLTMGSQTEDSVRIALAGRVPTKVSTENGPILRGDYLASSSTPGVAMKATKPGQTVGKALEPYTGEGIGMIEVFVNVSYADPNAILANLGLTADGSLNASGLRFDTGSGLNQALMFSGTQSPLTLTSVINGLDIRVEALEKLTGLLDTKVASQQAGLADLTARTASLEAMLSVVTPQSSLSGIFSATDMATGSAVSNQVPLVALTGDGLATVSGNMRVKGNTLLEGVLTVVDSVTAQNVIVSGLAHFFGDAVFKGNVNFASQSTFQGDVEFARRPTVNQDTAGMAVVKKDTDMVEVTFAKEYDTVPVVTVSLVLDGKDANFPQNSASEKETLQKNLESSVLDTSFSYVVSRKTAKGFIIKLNKKVTLDTSFNWVALSATIK